MFRNSIHLGAAPKGERECNGSAAGIRFTNTLVDAEKEKERET